MTEEMKKIIDDIIEQYEKNEVGKKLSEWEREIFVDAFLKGTDFSSNVGRYL